MPPPLDHQSASVSVVSVIPTRVRPLCVFLSSLRFLFVFVPLHIVKLFSFSCRVVYPFLCSCSCLCLCLCLVCPCPLALSSVPDHPCVFFASIRFSFDNLSPCDGDFHIMNSFRGTVDLDCPWPTNPSVQAVCFFLLIQCFRSISQTSFILSCQQC